MNRLVQRLKRLVSRPQQTKAPQFTDAQIAERAYILWQARQSSGKTGTEAGDWEAAKESLTVEHTLPKRWRSLWSPAPTAEAQKTALELHKLQLERWKVLISAFGVFATVLAGLGLYLTYKTGQEQQQLNTERLVTDRFAKAVEQLGSKETDVRIGAIYSLERIARDSPKDHWTIMEVLMAFVRNKSPLPREWVRDLKKGLPVVNTKNLPVVNTDVQSALTVMGRREVENDRKNDREVKYLDLRGTNLSGANLEGASLRSANLSRVDLSYARLRSANLHGADLSYARLIVANLNNADLSGADLSSADLRSANLSRADLRGAIGLRTGQIKAADYQDAYYYPDLRKALGLPPEAPKP